ncbi:MAG: hypothetical protein Q8P02_02555 [Candidatus Micrarchaeota archaeon]|nr:hypothetical protein [Candidatus Micrarchaeota archaeon]
MGFLDFFGKKPVRGFLFDLQASVHPFRLAAHRSDAVDLEVSITNASDQPQLTSVTIVVPCVLGLDRTGLMHEREVRLGTLQPGEQKRFKAGVFSNQKSAAGTYALQVFASAHYRDYGHLLNQVRIKVPVRVA